VPGPEDAGRIVQLAEEPGQGDRRDAGCDLEPLGRSGADRRTGNDVAGRFEDLAGNGEGGGLAGAGLADDYLDSRPRAGEPPDHRGLLVRQVLMVLQETGDESALHSRGTAASAGHGDLEEAGLDLEEFPGRLEPFAAAPPTVEFDHAGVGGHPVGHAFERVEVGAVGHRLGDSSHEVTRSKTDS
jgi:hypothetical protein